MGRHQADALNRHIVDQPLRGYLVHAEFGVYRRAVGLRDLRVHQCPSVLLPGTLRQKQYRVVPVTGHGTQVSVQQHFAELHNEAVALLRCRPTPVLAEHPA